MYWQLAFLGLTVAAALCTYYFTSHEQNAPHENRGGNEETKPQARRRNFSLSRASKPGDKCFWCTHAMSVEDWCVLNCQHALHKECHNELILEMNGKCLICQTADPCSICLCGPLNESNATYLSCGHALHTKCLAQLKESGYQFCPLCRKDI